MNQLKGKDVSLGLLIGALALLWGCQAQDLPVSKSSEEQSVNEWIEQTMRLYYLWEDEIPDSHQLDFNQEAEPFFTSLLTRKDGKTLSDGTHYYYSSINKKTADAATKSYLGEDYSFGFEFQYYYIPLRKIYALLVLYVLPDSPAALAGIRRGDWIVAINNRAVSGDTQTLLESLDTTSPVTVSFGFAERKDNFASVSKTCTLTATKVTDNPVFLHKVIPYGNAKVAYLVYNHFTAGPGETTGDDAFNRTLREAFRELKGAGADAFVLDLRYNGGGLLSCAQLLATFLAPTSALGDVFCTLSYNGQTNKYPKQQELMFEVRLAEGENMNLKKLFVITSQRTASASEAVINGLKPYLNSDLILVGDTTEGKNVGSLTFEDDNYDWELHPIVSRLSNREGFSDYSKGFAPDIFYDENHQDNTYAELGDPNEFILKPILEHIAYGTPIATRSDTRLRSEEPLERIPIYNSLDRKKTLGVILDR
ncbi:MAG: hypothetical protein LBD89_01655 [Tannerellaceae bacterium]|jgi:C-terminal processing protease CtpA/Prc|nr:hypothetical protein [Tannerellaceae bacterium]